MITWATVYAVGIGEMCLQPSELMDMTVKQFFWSYEGYKAKQQRASNEIWAVARWVTTMLINISGKSVKKEIKVHDLFKFKFEEDRTQKKKITAEQERHILEVFDKKPTKTEEVKTWQQLLH